MDRRSFLRLSLSAVIANAIRSQQALAAGGTPTAASAKACIVLWMNGGPSHLDTWDPKPGTSTGGPTRSIPTRTPGLEITANLPRLAERSNRYAVLRGMTSREGNHDRARHLLHTGYSPNPTVIHPSLGGWLSEEKGDPQAELPNFVSINGPSASAGFLGVQYGPFVVRDPTKPPRDVTLPRNVDDDRFSRREKALSDLESSFLTETGDPKVKGRMEVYGKAIRMMKSPKLTAFDLKDEPASSLAAYGDSKFGRGCLMARRLVQVGVPYVEVTLDGWDTHQDNFDRVGALCKDLDPAMSALLDDLAQRGLLDSTLVVWMGEFGRTPKINGTDGRDHYPGVWSAVVAGGGVKGGTVVGQTNATGEKIVARPIAVPELFATLVRQLGMNGDKTLVTPLGRPLSIVDSGKPVSEILT
jgi:hypothetical protein